MGKLKLWCRLVALVSAMFLAVGLCVRQEANQPAQAQTVPDKRPGLIVIMTDDQPKDTMLAMPQVRHRIAEQGMTLNNAYDSESLCAPSRASILRGQYPHNTKIQRNGPPFGGEEDFRANGLDRDTVATRLHSGGYQTGLVGKYINGYSANYTPPGWSYFWGRGDPGDPGVRVRENNHVIDYEGKPGNWGDRSKAAAMGFLDRRTDQPTDGPFALFYWTSYPHLPAGDYAKRYENMYQNAKLPAKPSFDEADVSDKPQWIKNRPRITDAQKKRLVEWRRNQLRSVRQTDDAIGQMLDLLQARGELDNTYIVFTSDNSTHMGEHRWYHDKGAKSTPYEEAANVPFYVRGPGIPANSVSNKLVLNHDIAPTLEEIAGVPSPDFTDGRSELPVWHAQNVPWRTAVLNERPVKDTQPPSAYHALMTQTRTYVEWETGERELYLRSKDPYQLNSRYNPASPPIGLQERLRELRSCAGETCTEAENGA